MIHPAHPYHCYRKFRTRVEFARTNNGPRLYRVYPQTRSIFWPLVIGLIAAAIVVASTGCTHKADPNPMPAVVTANQNTATSAKETLNLTLAIKRAAAKVGDAANQFKPLIDQVVASAKKTSALADDGLKAAQKASKTYDKMAKRYDDYQDDWFGPRMHHLFWGLGVTFALGLFLAFRFGGWWGLLHVGSLGFSWLIKFAVGLFAKKPVVGVGA